MSAQPIKAMVAAGILAGAVSLGGFPRPVRPIASVSFPDLEAACSEGRPYFVATCHLIATDNLPGADNSVMMFRDTPADDRQYLLASHRDVGSLWGLAYSHREHAVYGAAVRKRGNPVGPGGIGAIYRIDLDTGFISTFAKVPDAAAREPVITPEDYAAIEDAGRTGIGDIDLNDLQTELLAVNLHDRRIYRFSVPSGTLLGSFAIGSSGEPWAQDGRPFGLAFHGGRLYHAVVNTAESTRRVKDLRAVVYVSEPDGNSLGEAATVSLDYPRGYVSIGGDAGQLRWRPWDNTVDLPPRGEIAVRPMAQVSDLVIGPDQQLTLGLRDRFGDMIPLGLTGSVREALNAGAMGDLLYGRRIDGGWEISTGPEHYDDGINGSDESALGGLALDPSTGQVVSANVAVLNGATEPFDAIWYDVPSGHKVARETACATLIRALPPWPFTPGAGMAWPEAPIAAAHNEFSAMQLSIGDIEVLCTSPDTPTPTQSAMPTPTATSTVGPSPTPTTTPTMTATAIATATAMPTSTPSPTATPGPLYLPILLKERCEPRTQRTDAVLVIDTSTSMAEPTSAGRAKIDAARAAAATFLDQLKLDAGDQAAVVWFNEHAAVEQPLTSARALLDDALARLALQQFTRIDLGIALARDELVGPRHNPSNTAVMIVLTDGRANPVPVVVAVEDARRAKDAGVQLFTVGLGADLDEAALRQMASRPGWFYVAPDAEQLADIYRTIAVTIPCPPGSFWGAR